MLSILRNLKSVVLPLKENVFFSFLLCLLKKWHISRLYLFRVVLASRQNSVEGRETSHMPLVQWINLHSHFIVSVSMHQTGIAPSLGFYKK